MVPGLFLFAGRFSPPLFFVCSASAAPAGIDLPEIPFIKSLPQAPRSEGVMADLHRKQKGLRAHRIAPLLHFGCAFAHTAGSAACAARRDVLGLIAQCSDVHAQPPAGRGRVKAQPKWSASHVLTTGAWPFHICACSSTGRALVSGNLLTPYSGLE